MMGIMHESAFPFSSLSFSRLKPVCIVVRFLSVVLAQKDPKNQLPFAESGFIIRQVFYLTVICVGVDLQCTCEKYALFFVVFLNMFSRFPVYIKLCILSKIRSA